MNFDWTIFMPSTDPVIITPLMAWTVFASTVICVTGGIASAFMLMRQTRVDLDLTTLLGRGELALMYVLFVLERLFTGLTLVNHDFLITNVLCKVAFSTVLAISTFAMYRRLHLLRKNETS